MENTPDREVDETKFERETHDVCPDCATKLRPSCGCWVCPVCGYSKCNG